MSDSGAAVVHRALVSVDVPDRPHAHACSLLVLPDRTLVAWFTGSREGAADVGIVVSSSTDLRSWTLPEPLPLPAGPAWNPVLAVAPDGVPVLFVHVGPDPGRWRSLLSRWTGDGWAVPVELVPGPAGEGGRGPSRHRPVRRAGRWLAPGSREDSRPWRSFVDISEDNGAGWRRVEIPVVPGVDLIQPALVVCGDELVALLRSSDGRVHRTVSADGQHWRQPTPVPLPSTNSGIDAAVLPDGRLVCAHHPSAENWGPRCPLVLSVSDDRGCSWQPLAVVEDGTAVIDPRTGPGSLPGPDGFDRGLGGVGEYSYPSLAVRGEQLLVGYTWQRRGIALAVLDVDLC